MSARWGIFGGTFDPIHFGHLRAAEEVYEALGLEKMLFIPAGHPPHKYRPDLSPFEVRYRMVREAISGVPHFDVSDLEGQREGPSYSVLTLETLSQIYPKVDFFFVLGLDAFLEFGHWYRYRDLPRLAHLVVIPRSSGGERDFTTQVQKLFPEALREKTFWRLPEGKTMRFLPVTRLEISATKIREKVRSGASIRFLVPEAVRNLILQEGLYV